MSQKLISPGRNTSCSRPVRSGPMFEALEGRQLFSAGTAAIAAEYAATAKETDAYGRSVQVLLGSATSGVVSVPGVSGALMESFHYNGTIYWSPATGAHVVLGGIGAEYAQTAHETDAYGVPLQSLLGLPTSDETAIPYVYGGRQNIFQGGVIEWGPNTGAHAVIGGIENLYRNAGGGQSWLGLPTTDEGGSATFRLQSFQNGYVEWTPYAGATAFNTSIAITMPGNNLAFTLNGTRDSIYVDQSGSTLTITADGESWAEPVPAGRLELYTNGGYDTVVIDSDVSAATTIYANAPNDSAPTWIYAYGSNVITYAYSDENDAVYGDSTVHYSRYDL